jgi:hypothetical protein
MQTSLITVVLLLAAATPIVAGDYYKWIDDAGTVHLSDSVADVPPQYRDQIQEGRLAEPAPVVAAAISPAFDGLIGGRGQEVARGRGQEVGVSSLLYSPTTAK